MNEFDFQAVITGIFAGDLIRYVIGAGGIYLFVNLVFAARLYRRKIREKSPGWVQIRREILSSIRTVAIFATVGSSVVFGAHLGIFKVYGAVQDFGWAYFVGTTIFVILLHDTYFYWMHRAFHRPRLFRIFHRLHHRSHNPSPFAAYAFDVGEALGNAIYLPIVLLVLPMHPIALLIFTSHMMLRNAMGHCGYELFPANRHAKPLFGWMTTVTHHDLHHAHAGYNIGLYFTWWDKWMGTEHPHYLAEYARVAPPFRQKRMMAAFAVVLAMLALGVSHAQAKELRGEYASPGIGIIVRFDVCQTDPAATCGQLLWSWDRAATGHAEPGDIIIEGLIWDGQGWSGGKLLNPENGRIYRGSVSQSRAVEIHLMGCAGPFCKAQVWRSVADIRAVLRSFETQGG